MSERILFSIPLAPKRDPESWRIVCRLLDAAVASALRQTDPEVEVIVAGHDRPEVPALDDPRVTFLVSDHERPAGPEGYTLDKYRKRRLTFREIARRGGGYVVMQDADDLVSRRLASFIRADRAPHGYAIETGYALDLESGAMAPMPGVWSGPFHQCCGTATIVRLLPADFRGEEPYAKGFSRGHRVQAALAAEAGRPLAPIPFPAAVYVVNSRVNISEVVVEARSRETFEKKARQIQRMSCADDALREEFGVSALYAEVA